MRSDATREPLWSIPFALVTIATAVVFFGLYFLVLAVPGYASALGADPTRVGLVVSLPSFTAAASRLAISGAARRHGQKPFLMIGLILFAGAASGHAYASGLSGLLLTRALLGVGWGWTSTALGTLVTELTPASRRGEAIGIWGMAPTVAMAAGPALGAVLLGAGGHEVVFVAAAMLAVGSLLLVAPVREPRDAAPAAESPSGALRPAGHLPKGALLPSTVSLLSSLSYGAVIAFVPLRFANDVGHLGAWFTLYAAGILVARPLLGRLSDRVGRLAIIHPSLALGAAGMALLAAGTPAALWLSAILYGVGIGGGAFPGLMALTVDRCPPRQRGAAMALFFTAYDLSIAGGAALMGPLYDWKGLPAVGLAAAGFILIAQLLLRLRAGAAARPAGEGSASGA